jgi:hypothetical protein
MEDNNPDLYGARTLDAGLIKADKHKDGSKSKSNKSNNSLITTLDTFDDIADRIMESSYVEAFKKNVKVGIDKDGKSIYESKVEKSDIIASLMLGNELGFSPMATIALGKQISSKSYLAVQRGNSLGLDKMTSLSKIYAFTNKNGDIITALDVSIILKCILDTCDKMEYIRDYEYARLYYNMLDNSYIGHEFLIMDKNNSINPKYFIYIKDITNPNDLREALSENKIPIIAKGTTYVTSLRLVRNSKAIDKTFHYSIQDAIDAGLHRGYHSILKDTKGNSIRVDGRDNWNNHPPTMLRNRVSSIAGRVVSGDIIQGGYSTEEASEFIDITERQ